MTTKPVADIDVLGQRKTHTKLCELYRNMNPEARVTLAAALDKILLSRELISQGFDQGGMR